MEKNRLEAFSDGVIAIIITIMVLELKVPHGDDARGAGAAAAGVPELRAELRLPRHLLEQPPPHAARRASASPGRCCGPTCTCCSGCRWCRSSPAGWARTTSPRCRPRCYGVVLLMAAIAYWILQQTIIAVAGPRLASCQRRSGRDWKGKSRRSLYVVAIPLAFVAPRGSRRRSTCWWR